MGNREDQLLKDTQAALRVWESAHPEARKAHLGNLRRTLISRGRWNEVGAAAVAELLGLAANHATPDRHHLLVLTADVLAGDHTTRMGSGLDLREEELRTALEQDPAARIHAAVRERLPDIQDSLNDPQAAVRSAAGLVLAFLPSAAPTCMENLVARLGEEEHPLVRASLALSLGMCNRNAQAKEASETLSRLSTDDTDPVVLGAVELARLWGLSAEDGGADVDRLAGLIQAANLDQDLFPWHRGHPDRLIEAWAFQARGWASALGARTLARASVILGMDPQRTRGWIQMALGLLFDPSTSIADPDSLTKAQRDLIADLSHGEVGDPGFSAHGIPHRAVDRRRWLGLDPPGPLDLLVELGQPLADLQGTQPLWRILGALQREPGMTDDGILNRLSGLVTPERVLEVLPEACDFAYLLRPIQIQAMAKAVDNAGSKAGAWARAQADALLATDQPNPERSDLAQVALYGIVRCLKSGETLQPRYEALIELQAPFVRQVLTAIPQDRLEALFVHTLDSIPPQAYSEQLDLILPLIDLCPTDAVARRVIHLTSEQTLGRWILDGSAREWFVHFESLLAELTADRPDLDDALERARSTTEGRRS